MHKLKATEAKRIYGLILTRVIAKLNPNEPNKISIDAV